MTGDVMLCGFASYIQQKVGNKLNMHFIGVWLNELWKEYYTAVKATRNHCAGLGKEHWDIF